MNLLTSGQKYSPTFIFAHGAGAPMDSDWMNAMTKRLAKQEIRVVRFEFPYMDERRQTGKKRPPNSKTILLETWDQVIKKQLKLGHQVYIGGKSMGGRMASLVADHYQLEGLIALGFPFHAPGPDKEPGERITHLATLKTPSLIIQGTRDPLGTQDECRKYALSKAIQFEWLEDGDHSFKPRKKSGYTLDQHLDQASSAIAHFIKAGKVN